MSLLELIVKTGIANVINTQLGGLRGNRNAIAETIENNVRRKIIKERLTDPAFYDKMSALLDEIIALRKAKAIEYEEYLKRVAELAKSVGVGAADDTPEPLKKSQALRAVYNNLKPAPVDHVAEIMAKYGSSEDPMFALAIAIDETVKKARPDDWRDNGGPKEQVVKAALYKVLGDEDAVEQIFPIIKAQAEY
jgi:type I restriction enzyme R subunit